MPRISEFYGVSIYMYFDDHGPPHFHAMYAGTEAIVAIEDGGVLRGHLPARVRTLVAEWADRYRRELSEDWERARRHERLERIPPLE